MRIAAVMGICQRGLVSFEVSFATIRGKVEGE